MKKVIVILFMLSIACNYVFSQCTCTAGCSSLTVISMPFTKDGAGEFCYQASCIGAPINSWNVDKLVINGVDFTNKWADASTLPAAASDGYYYIYYKGSYSYSHFEASGSCSGSSTNPPSSTILIYTPDPTNAPADTAGPTVPPGATVVPTETPGPTAIPTATPVSTEVAVVTTEPVITPGPTSGSGTTIQGNQVIVIGESFIAMSHEITKDLEQLAKNAGILPSGESFIDNSVSGTRLSGGSSPTIPQQYANGNTQKTVKWVIMDGGGNDCLQGSCSTPPTESCTDLQNAVTAARNLLAQMGNDDVLKVIYFFYPEPQADSGGLKAKLDVLRPMIRNVVNSSVKPVCYWIDLRPIFEGHYSEYISSDGIHPTSAGCQATANAIWDIIQQNNFFSGN